jgi:formylglycine-generating enzyme required for sulfatase activity
VLGTVPVQPDGSARFTVPANTPISVQPLDAEGKALQLMRSWMTAMPGETVQCTGCHERANQSPPTQPAARLQRAGLHHPPWHGPVRGFSFAREVQPVLDHHCLPCHAGSVSPDLRGDRMITDWSSTTPGNGGAGLPASSPSPTRSCTASSAARASRATTTCWNPWSTTPTPPTWARCCARVTTACAWTRRPWTAWSPGWTSTAPYHGTWSEHLKNPGQQRERRRDLLKTYANVDDDPEALPPPDAPTYTPPPNGACRTPPVDVAAPRVEGWPFDGGAALRLQSAGVEDFRRDIQVAPGHTLRLVRVPAGSFVMGEPGGADDERALARVDIRDAFWMGAHEVSNALYNLFDPAHDSRVESKNTYQFGVHGYPMNRPEQPVVRVSWDEAMAFCAWLGARTGRAFTLPSEAQWEWACRAGADTPFAYGGPDADFSGHANFADVRLRDFASDPYTVDKPLAKPSPYDDWMPKDARFNDGALLTVAGGKYLPNAWGLFDLHGNAAEWTRSAYRPHPWKADDRDDPAPCARRVVKGGSWRDPPARGAAGARIDYEPWQRVYNVGFRVICQDPPAATQARAR